MTRNRATAKQAGARFERSVADYLAQQLDDRIDRRVKTGAKDCGDIAGIRHQGEKVVAELKDYGGQIKATTWLNEAQIEAGNDDAAIGLVIAKRRGTTDPAQQFVVMELRDLVWLLGGPTPNY